MPCEQLRCLGCGEWERWGTCSVTCEADLRRRDRNIDNPYPSTDSYHCFGESINYEICMKPSCSHLDTDVIMFTARNLANTSLHSNEDAIGNLELVQNGNPLQRGEIVGDEYAQCASLQALSNFQKGDRVWVRCTNYLQFYQDEPYRWATFSGALVHRYFSESVSGPIIVG